MWHEKLLKMDGKSAIIQSRSLKKLLNCRECLLLLFLLLLYFAYIFSNFLLFRFYRLVSKVSNKEFSNDFYSSLDSDYFFTPFRLFLSLCTSLKSFKSNCYSFNSFNYGLFWISGFFSSTIYNFMAFLI